MRKSLVATFTVFSFLLLRGAAISLADDTTAVQTDVLARLTQVEAELAALRSATPASDVTPGEDYFDEAVVARGSAFAGAEATLLVPQASTLVASGTVLGTPLGSIELTPQYGSFVSGRYWLGYRNANGLGGRVRFWNYNASATGTLGGIVPLTTTLHALALDGEVTQVGQFGDFQVDGSFGLRFGEIQHTGRLPAAAFSQQFSGLGPTAALWVNRPLHVWDLSLVGGGRGSFLFGNNNYRADLDPLATVTLTARNSTLMVYEMQGGLEWSRDTSFGSRFFARAVAEAQVWQVPPAAFGLLDRTTGLVGATFSAGLDW